MEFEPSSFLRLYQTAHSESTVDKRDNSTEPIKQSMAKIIGAATEIYGGGQIADRKLRLAMLQKRTPSGIYTLRV